MTPEAWAALKQRFLDMAEVFDACRIFPRVVLTGYGYWCWSVGKWFMALGKEAGTEQMAFVSAVVGMAAVIFGFYVNSGRRWQ